MDEKYSRASDDQDARHRDVQFLLAGLRELEAFSTSSNEHSAPGKDEAATEAISLLAYLADLTAGWAIRHKVGLAKAGLTNIPAVLPEARTPEYMELVDTVDDPSHEMVGAADDRLSDRSIRLVLFNLIKSGSRSFPSDSAQRILDALEALEYGEVLPLFARNLAGRKRSFSELRLQLYGICCVEYSVTLGNRKFMAQQSVAEAYGVASSTLRGWELSLRKEWKNHRVANLVSRAKKCAEGDKATGDNRFEAIFGLSAANRYGAKYKKLLGFSSPA
jgi:hypothetical protein